MSVMPSQGLHGRRLFCSPLSRFLGKSPLEKGGLGGIWHRRGTVPSGVCPHFHDAIDGAINDARNRRYGFPFFFPRRSRSTAQWTRHAIDAARNRRRTP